MSEGTPAPQIPGPLTPFSTMPKVGGEHATPKHHGIPFGGALRVWLRVAALSFGGPAGQIAVMHRIVVDEKRWIGEARFLHALSYRTLLPGPEAQQLAICIGRLMHGIRGGIAAGTLFVLPGVLCIMALSYVYEGSFDEATLCHWGHLGVHGRTGEFLG